jgi:hypothetical protein
MAARFGEGLMKVVASFVALRHGRISCRPWPRASGADVRVGRHGGYVGRVTMKRPALAARPPGRHVGDDGTRLARIAFTMPRIEFRPARRVDHDDERLGPSSSA